MAASWEASGGSLFAALRSIGVSGISGSVAAGLGAAFGTAAVVLTTLFGKKKTEPRTEKQAEPINEQPVRSVTSAPTQSVKIEKRDEQDRVADEPAATVSVKTSSESVFKNVSTVQRSEAVVEAQIISIPETKVLQEEAMPIQSEVHFEAVQAIENQIIHPVHNAEREEEEQEEVEEEDEESENEAVVCYPSKPTTFSEQILAAREVVESVSSSERPTPESHYRDGKTTESELKSGQANGEEEEEESEEYEEEEDEESDAKASPVVAQTHSFQMNTQPEIDVKEELIVQASSPSANDRLYETEQKLEKETEEDEEEEEYEEEEEEEQKVVQTFPTSVTQSHEYKHDSEDEDEYEEDDEETSPSEPVNKIMVGLGSSMQHNPSSEPALNNKQDEEESSAKTADN